jgi:hypothetical protein
MALTIPEVGGHDHERWLTNTNSTFLALMGCQSIHGEAWNEGLTDSRQDHSLSLPMTANQPLIE